MKKVFALVLIIALVSSVFCLSANAADASIEGASVQAAPGETVAVPFSLVNNPGFMYMQVRISVDEGLTVASINRDDATVRPESFSATQVSNGYNVSFDDGADVTGDGVLFTVNVTVAEGASGTLNVNIVMGNAGIYNYDEDDVEFEFVAGEVEVEAAAEAPALVMCNMDIFDLSGTTLTVQGWAGANYPANNLGYQVDGGEVVFDGIEFRPFNTEQEGEIIKANAGQYAFRFASVAAGIDLSTLEDGEHTITLVVRVDGPEGNANVVMKSKTFTLTHEVPAPSLHSMSFNTVWVDGTQICDEGDALAYLAANPITGDVQSIGLRGWARLANGEIGQFGYRIDSGDPVFSDAYLQNRADVQAAFGVSAAVANGFNVNPIDVSAVADGEHTITVLVKATDDTVIEVVTVPFSIERPEPPVTYSLLNVSYDTLRYDSNTLVDGGADKWIHNLEDPSVLDFQVGTVSNITVRGWVRISEDVADITGFGYSIDNGAVVTDASFVEERSAELAGAGFPGAQGFTIIVPVADLAVGQHSIDAYVIAADGTEIKIVKDRSTTEVQDIRQVGVTFNVTEEELPPQPAALSAMSFNTVWVDGTQICDEGDALAYLAANPIDGDIESVGFRGWAWIANSTIESFGYSIDGGEPVFDAAYIQDRADVQAAFGVTADVANGFCINPIDVSGLETGAHTATLYVKAADGNNVQIVEVPFSVTRPVVENPVALHNFSFDTLWLDYNQMVDGKANEWIEQNPNFGFINIISVRGWAWIDNGAIESFGYSIDEGEPVFNAAYIEQRADVQAAFGVTADEANGFFINPIDVSALKTGDHRMRLYVKATDGSVVEITSFAFTLERAGWLCDSASGVMIPGLWMTQPGQYIDINFTSPEAFKGFCALIYANVEGVTVEFSLIHEGKELESFEYSQAGDGAPTLFFERAYPAGTYTLRITAVQFNPNPDAGFGWFVLGTSDPIDNGYPVTIEGTHTLGAPADGHPDSLTAPLMFLVLAESAEDLPADPAALHAMSFNTVWVDGTQICDVGDALAYLAENPIDGDISTLAFRGWAWIDNSTIESFGYAIDGGEPVFDAAYIQDRADVQAAFGVTADVANGFNIQGIDVSGLATGAHTATLYVKAADGTAVEIVEVPFNVTRPAPQSTLQNMSFNTVWVDGTQVCDVGDALGFLAENPIDGDISTLAFRGWAWINDSTIESFGYAIDGGEPVFDAAYIQDRADVQAAFGVTADVANGFNIQGIDVSGLATGAHTATLYVKAADGNNIVIVEVPFNVTRPAPAFALLNVSYDELLYDGTQILSESVYKKLVELEDPSILDFEEGAVSTITVRGWVRISEEITDIMGFGYSIDGGEVVTGEFIQDRAAELSGAGYPGGQGFVVEVPVADLAAGEHSIDVYVIAADGSQIKVVKVKNEVEYQVGVTFNVTEAAVIPTPTSDIAIVAIAAVACIAAAGVVIGKKKLGK